MALVQYVVSIPLDHTAHLLSCNELVQYVASIPLARPHICSVAMGLVQYVARIPLGHTAHLLSCNGSCAICGKHTSRPYRTSAQLQWVLCNMLQAYL